MNYLHKVFLLTYLALIAPGLIAQNQRVLEIANSIQFVRALEDLRGGDVLKILPGEYDLQKRVRISVVGSEKSTVSIIAKEPGTVILKGSSWLTFKNASYITIESLDFQSTDGPVIELFGCSAT